MFFCILFFSQWMRQQWISGDDDRATTDAADTSMDADDNSKQFFSFTLLFLSISNCILYFSQGMRRQWISGDDGGATTEEADTYMDADDNSKQCLCVHSSNALSLLSLIPILLIYMHLLFKDTSLIYVFCILFFSQWMRQQWISGDDDRATTDAADTSMDADDNSKQFFSFTLFFIHF